MRRLRSLSEAECYARCYGWRGGDDSVRVLRDARRSVRHEATPAGELLRALLQDKLDTRAPEAA